MWPGKTHRSAPTNVVLGVVADLSAVASSHQARFHPDPEKVERVLGTFSDAFERGKLKPHEASRLRGRLHYPLSAAYAMVGRATTLPLVQRQYRDSDWSFPPDSELHHSLLFFRALLPNLPPLTLDLIPPDVPPLLLYTDASFWTSLKRPRLGTCTLKRRRQLHGALGAVLFDPVDRSVRYAYARPPWAILLSSWREERKTYIAELETLAAVAAYSTYPQVFKGRKVNHFIDNTVALSALVNGYSGKPNLAKAVNTFHLQLVGLRTAAYLDYVPSKANIADLPSREMFSALRLELAGLRPARKPDALRIPSVSQWRGPLSEWAIRPDARSTRMPV